MQSVVVDGVYGETRGDLVQPAGSFTFSDVASNIPGKARPSGIALKLSPGFCERVFLSVNACMCRHFERLFRHSLLLLLKASLWICEDSEGAWLQLWNEGVSQQREKKGHSRIWSHRWFSHGCATLWTLQLPEPLRLWNALKHTDTVFSRAVISLIQTSRSWDPRRAVLHSISCSLCRSLDRFRAKVRWRTMLPFTNIQCHSTFFYAFPLFLKWIRLQRGQSRLICSLLWRSRRMTSYWSRSGGW